MKLCAYKVNFFVNRAWLLVLWFRKKKNRCKSFLKMFESKIDNLYQLQRNFQFYIGACTHATSKKYGLFFLFSLKLPAFHSDQYTGKLKLITNKTFGITQKSCLNYKVNNQQKIRNVSRIKIKFLLSWMLKDNLLMLEMLFGIE